MPANIHARHPHPILHARQQSISDPLPIPTLSGLEATGAVETAAATGTALVLPSNVPTSNGGGDANQGIPLVPGQSAVTVTSTTPASGTPVASTTDANTSSSPSSSSSNANASSGSNDDLSIPTVVGICVGVFAGLALIILCVVWWSKKHGVKSRKRGAGGRKGGRFEPIPDDRSFVSGEDETTKGAGADAGVKGMEKIRGSRVRFEKPPPYESYIAPRSSTTKGPELTVPTNTQLPPISPSSPISISPIHFRSTSPTPLQAAHVPQPQNRRVSYGQTLTVQTNSYNSHPYASPLLSARTPSPNSAYSPTPPHSANIIAGAGFGAAQAQYHESRALLEGRNRVPNETPTPTSSSQTHATFVTAASIGVPGSGYNDDEDVLPAAGGLGARLTIPKQSYSPDQISPLSGTSMHTAASQLSTTSARIDQRALGSKPSHTKLGFNSSLGMSQTFHDRSSLYAASALDPDTSTSTSSEDHSFLSMRNSDLSLQLRMNMKTSPEAKSPALQFDFTQADAHKLEREGEVVTPPAVDFGAGGIGSRRETFGMGTGANIGSGKPWIQMNRMDSSSSAATAATADSTTAYSTSTSSSQTRPSLTPKHTRSNTTTSTSTTSSSNTIRNPFSDIHANAHTLPKLTTVPLSRADSNNAYTPGHKKMASLLAALNIPVTPSSESGDDVDTVVDAH